MEIAGASNARLVETLWAHNQERATLETVAARCEADVTKSDISLAKAEGEKAALEEQVLCLQAHCERLKEEAAEQAEAIHGARVVAEEGGERGRELEKEVRKLQMALKLASHHSSENQRLRHELKATEEREMVAMRALSHAHGATAASKAEGTTTLRSLVMLKGGYGKKADDFDTERKRAVNLERILRETEAELAGRNLEILRLEGAVGEGEAENLEHRELRDKHHPELLKRTSLLQFKVDALADTYAELDRWRTV